MLLHEACCTIAAQAAVACNRFIGCSRRLDLESSNISVSTISTTVCLCISEVGVMPNPMAFPE